MRIFLFSTVAFGMWFSSVFMWMVQSLYISCYRNKEKENNGGILAAVAGQLRATKKEKEEQDSIFARRIEQLKWLELQNGNTDANAAARKKNIFFPSLNRVLIAHIRQTARKDTDRDTTNNLLRHQDRLSDRKIEVGNLNNLTQWLNQRKDDNKRWWRTYK